MSRGSGIPILLLNQQKPAGFDSNDGFSSRHGLALTLTSRWRRWVSRSRFRASWAVFTLVRSENTRAWAGFIGFVGGFSTTSAIFMVCGSPWVFSAQSHTRERVKDPDM
jgi:hypothetical protein